MFLAIVLGFFLFSCKKDNNANTQISGSKNGKKYAVKFKVSDFEQSVQGFSLLSATKGQVINTLNPGWGDKEYLYYSAFDATGAEVSRLFQNSAGRVARYDVFSLLGFDSLVGDYTFGTLPDSLPAGSYTAVIIASQFPLGLNSRTAVTDFRVRPLSQAYFCFDRGLDSWSRTTDVFFKKITFNVGNSDTEQSVVLDRIVAKAEITLEDAIPAGASYFTFQFINENEGYKYSDETSYGSTDDDFYEQLIRTYIKPTEIGTTNYKFNKLIINTKGNINVIINCYDANSELIAGKTINNVKFYKNKKTLLKGKLFTTPNPQSAFNVSIDDEWNSEEDEVNF